MTIIDRSDNMLNVLHDPIGLVYENLFFFLSAGKCDCILAESYNSIYKQKYNYYEEFLIVEETWKDRLEYLEEVIPILVGRDLRENIIYHENPLNTNTPVDFKIYFVVYTSISTEQMVGLGLRIFTPNRDLATSFAPTPEDRLQKAMYLLSRGLLRSNHHSIEQIELVIPI